MAEVKSLCHVNGISKPLTEVRVVQLATAVFSRAFVIHDLHQVLELYFHVGSKSLDKVLRLNPAIMVEVKFQKGLPH